MTKDEVIDLVKDTGFCFLATIDEKQPRVRPMMPYLSEAGEMLIALLPRSRTITQIKANSRVEICFVDRKMWYCRITGEAQISSDVQKKKIVWDNVPMLRQYFSGPTDTNFILATITPTSVEAMTPQSKSPELIKWN